MANLGTQRKAHFQGVCVSILQRRSWHHCQQLGDFLRVAGGVGSYATAKAVDGRAEPMQLRDKRSRLIATPNCNSHVEADNGNHTFSPPRQICRAWCRAAPRFVAQSVLEPKGSHLIATPTYHSVRSSSPHPSGGYEQWARQSGLSRPKPYWLRMLRQGWHQRVDDGVYQVFGYWL